MVRVFIPKFRSTHHLLVLLFFVWCLCFLFHERFVPYYSAKSCKWPVLEVKTESKTEFDLPRDDEDNDKMSSDKAINIMLIADPQLIDNHTYPGRNDLLLKLSQHTVDAYLKRNYNSLIKHLKPDYIFFLGDYLDNGRSASDSYFKKEFKRFNKIFRKGKFKKGKKLITNVAGNHDIGWADGVKLNSRKRFHKYFGKPNTIKTLNNVEFVTLDTISLSANELEINSDAREFLDTNFGTSIVKTKPRVLLSHVPLFRDTNEVSCGPLRESSIFSTQAGYQYQSVIGQDLSQEILAKVDPDLIFSGDDHDYCDMIHESENAQKSREITVKSISMAMGIKFPAIQILSFTNSHSQEDYMIQNNFKYETKLCYTQTPYVNIVNYVILAFISGILVLWCDIKHRSSRYNYSILPVLNGAFNGSQSVPNSSNSKKISNFLKQQDEIKSNLINLPQYTFTNVPSTSRVRKNFGQIKFKFDSFMKKWNLYGFVKHIVILGVFVVLLYYFGFFLTL